MPMRFLCWKSMPSMRSRNPCTKCWRDCSPPASTSSPTAWASASPPWRQAGHSFSVSASQKGLGRLPAMVVSSMGRLPRQGRGLGPLFDRAPEYSPSKTMGSQGASLRGRPRLSRGEQARFCNESGPLRRYAPRGDVDGVTASLRAPEKGEAIQASGGGMIDELLATRDWLLADGATGTNLFAMGLVSGEAPEVWNETHPERVQDLHRRFVAAGADIILTNSFGCNRRRLAL